MSITRDVWLAVRIRDYASNILNNLLVNSQQFSNNLNQMNGVSAAMYKKNIAGSLAVGTAISGLGMVMIGLGATGVRVFRDLYNAGEEYKGSLLLALTQIEQGAKDNSGALIDVHKNVRELGDSVYEIGSKVPVSLETLATGFYDIYSSIEGISKLEADQLLTTIAKAAVAGGSSVEVAGQGIMQVMNAWGLSASEATKISDIMFQSVRDGIMTYDEFTNSMGRAIPSVIKAGGSFADLAGAMTFLTKRGLSAEMSATAVARAFDLLTNPKTQKNFENLGLSVFDASGKMKSMTTVVGELKQRINGAFDGISTVDANGNLKETNVLLEEMYGKANKMNDKQLFQFMKDLFQSGGMNAQAMRFMTLALLDTNGELEMYTDKMSKASGTTEDAYNIMIDSSKTAKQVFENNITRLSELVQQTLEPAVTSAINFINGLLEKFNTLDPAIRENIISAATWVIGFLLIGGAIATIVGAIVVAVAVMNFFGVTLLGLLGPVGIVIGVIALLAVGIYFLIKYWDQVVTFLQPVINAFKVAGSAIADFAVQVYNGFINSAKAVADFLSSALEPAVSTILWAGESIKTGFGFLVDGIINLWDGLSGAIMALWYLIVNFFSGIANAISGPLDDAKGPIDKFLSAVHSAIGPVVQILSGAIGVIITIVEVVVGVIFTIVGVLGKIVDGIFKVLYPIAGFVGSIIGTIINAVINFVTLIINVIGGFADVIVKIFSGDIAGAFQSLIGIVVQLTSDIIGFFADLVSNIVGAVTKLVDDIIHFFTVLWDELVGHSIIPDMVNAIIMWFANLINTVVTAVSDFVTGIIQFFVDLGVNAYNAVIGFVNNVVTGFTMLWEFVSGLVTMLVTTVVNWFINLGSSIINTVVGFVTGVITWFSNLNTQAVQYVTNLVINGIAQFNNFKSNLISTVSNAINNVISFFASLPGRALSAISSFASSISSTANGWMDNLKSAISNGINNAISFFASMPGRITGALGNIGSLLINSGSSLLSGFISGITSGFSRALDAVKNGLSKIRNFFPFSPAKEGPFSGRGYLTYSGSAMMNDYAKSILKNSRTLYSAVDTVMGNVQSEMTPSFELGGYRPTSLSEQTGAGTSNTNVNVNVYTNEIDPVQNSKELAFRISRDLGL